MLACAVCAVCAPVDGWTFATLALHSGRHNRRRCLDSDADEQKTLAAQKPVSHVTFSVSICHVTAASGGQVFRKPRSVTFRMA